MVQNAYHSKQVSPTPKHMKRKIRRPLAIALMILGALLLVMAPETSVGLALLIAGAMIEIIGLALEHKKN